MPAFKYTKTILWFLIAFAFFSRLWIAGFDKAPAIWDEQYHLLVAKNLTKHPAVPTLVDNPILDYNQFGWTDNHVWLHKPPLFLYSMAGSMKLFGTTLWAGRLPSVLLSSLMVFVVFAIGRELKQPRIGLIAAALWASLAFNYRLIRGLVPTDHNDVHFVVLVGLSLWLFFRYQNNKNYLNATIVGLVVGMSVLTKWLPGLLVFLPWGVFLLIDFIKDKKIDFARAGHFGVAFFFMLMLVLPWHIYTYTNFTVEYLHEMAFNQRHFREVIESHVGEWYYHFEVMDIIYGSVFTIVVVPGIVLGYRYFPRRYFWQIILMMGFVYFFFSLAATKMISFTLILAPLWMLFAGATLIWIYDRFKNQTLLKFLWIALFATVINTMLKPTQIIKKHTGLKESELREKHALIFSDWQKNYETKNWVLFNVPSFREPQFMFFTDGTAYYTMPDSSLIERLDKEGYTLLIYHQEEDSFEFLNREGIQ